MVGWWRVPEREKTHTHKEKKKKKATSLLGLLPSVCFYFYWKKKTCRTTESLNERKEGETNKKENNLFDARFKYDEKPFFFLLYKHVPRQVHAHTHSLSREEERENEAIGFLDRHSIHALSKTSTATATLGLVLLSTKKRHEFHRSASYRFSSSSSLNIKKKKKRKIPSSHILPLDQLLERHEKERNPLAIFIRVLNNKQSKIL